jgi:F-type H+-transporting ATPase subunit delta
VGDELFRIARAFESSPELRAALTDPRLPLERKQSIVDDLLEGKTSSLAINLVNFVVGVGMTSDLPAIADRLAERAAAERNKVLAEVRTAVELDEETIGRLGESLSRATGKDVEVKTVVDPSIVGGIVAKVGDIVIDGSLSNRMQELRETLNRR